MTQQADIGNSIGIWIGGLLLTAISTGRRNTLKSA